MSPSLPSYELGLLSAMDALAVAIAEGARDTPGSAADDYIDRELAKFAVQMRRYEGIGRTSSASVGYAVDAWLRERIAASLAERTR